MMKNLLLRRGSNRLLVEWRFDQHETENNKNNNNHRDENNTAMLGGHGEMDRSNGSTSSVVSRSNSLDNCSSIGTTTNHETDQQQHQHHHLIQHYQIQQYQPKLQQAWRNILKFPKWKRNAATRDDDGGGGRHNSALTMLTMEDEIDFMASLELTDALSCLQMELRNKVAECETLQENSTRLSNLLTKTEQEHEEKSIELERLQFRMQAVTFVDSPSAKRVNDDHGYDQKGPQQHHNSNHKNTQQSNDELYPTTKSAVPPPGEHYPTRLSQAQVDEILKERDMAIARADHLAGMLNKTKQENDRLEGLLRKTKALFHIARTTISSASTFSSLSSSTTATKTSQGGNPSFPGMPFGRFIRKGMFKNSDPVFHLDRFETSPSVVSGEEKEEEEEKSAVFEDDNEFDESLRLPPRNGNSNNLFCQRLDL